MKPYKIINGIQTYISRRGYGRGVVYSWIYIDGKTETDEMICLGDPWKAINPSVREIGESIMQLRTNPKKKQKRSQDTWGKPGFREWSEKEKKHAGEGLKPMPMWSLEKLQAYQRMTHGTKKRKNPGTIGKPFSKFLFDTLLVSNVRYGDIESIWKNSKGDYFGFYITSGLRAITDRLAHEALKYGKQTTENSKRRSTSMNPRSKYYVGFFKSSRKPEIFQLSKKPTIKSHGRKYHGVIGPAKDYNDAVRIVNQHMTA